MKPGHAETIHQLLAVYRFLAYGLAVVLIQAAPQRADDTLDTQNFVILSLLGVYTFLKVFSPLRWREREVATYIVLGGDLMVGVFLLLFTEGLDSAYLLYSLIPVTTSALLFPQLVARVMAGLTAATPVVAHTVLSQFTERHAWIMDGSLLPQLLLYVGLCFLIATLAYPTNVNIRRRIVQEAVQDERQRTRRELHDGVAQSLNYLRLRIQQINKSLPSGNSAKLTTDLEELHSVVRATYEDIREAIDQFSTEVMTRPLLPALADYIHEFSQRNVMPVEFTPPETLRELSPQAELQLLRIAQEALTNVRKHTQATKVWVTFNDTDDGVELRVTDNGQGFDTSADQAPTADGGHGLRGMREWAEELGGVLEVHSTPGEGTELLVAVPREKVRH